jgi:glutamate synthase domain-containing protein 2
MFWTVFWGGLAALAAFGVLLVALMPVVDPWFMNLVTDRLFKSLVRTPYIVSLGSFWSLMQRAGPQVFTENLLRAARPAALERPMGTPRTFSPWAQLIFSPAQVRRLPTLSREDIDLKVVIGPRAERPLTVDIPILIAGMSYGGALSAAAKIALARGASDAGTATNTGENYLPAERQAADRLIVQYHRGSWPLATQHHPEWLEQADAIEIQLGQGAQAAVELRQRADKISPEMRRVMGLQEGEDAVIRSRFEGVDHAEDMVQLIHRLKDRYPVPVGVKIAAGVTLREDLDILLDAPLDFITLDGGEGGTHAGPPILQDDFGIPLMTAVAWTDDLLRERRRRHEITVLAAGGLKTPGEFLKALALGADAVYIGFAALMAMAAAQASRVLPWAPPEALFYESGASKHRLETIPAAAALTRFLQSSADELRYGLQALGYTRLGQLSRGDLVALDPWTAALAEVTPVVELDWATVPVPPRRRPHPEPPPLH